MGSTRICAATSHSERPFHPWWTCALGDSLGSSCNTPKHRTRDRRRDSNNRFGRYHGALPSARLAPDRGMACALCVRLGPAVARCSRGSCISVGRILRILKRILQLATSCPINEHMYGRSLCIWGKRCGRLLRKDDAIRSCGESCFGRAGGHVRADCITECLDATLHFGPCARSATGAACTGVHAKCGGDCR